MTTSLILTAITAVPVVRAEQDDKPGGAPVLPPGSHKYGKSLIEWTEMYWRWFYEGGLSETEPYKPTESALVFMPLPQGTYMGGSFTSEDPGILQGTIEVTIERHAPFFLPCFAWISETYNTGQDDDPVIPENRIKSVAVNPSGSDLPDVTLDGEAILLDFWDYYVGPAQFDPVVTYPEPTGYGSIGAVAFQGVGFAMKPLSKGTHVLHLYERLRVTNDDLPGYQFPYDLGIIYDNTWIIHVE